MDIDTLTLVSFVILSTLRVVERVVEKNPCTEAIELIYEDLTPLSWCYDVYCLHMLNGMLTVVYSLCYAFVMMLCCVECMISC
jgi:hypothetical protein